MVRLRPRRKNVLVLCCLGVSVLAQRVAMNIDVEVRCRHRELHSWLHGFAPSFTVVFYSGYRLP